MSLQNSRQMVTSLSLLRLKEKLFVRQLESAPLDGHRVLR
jgi:hypothetical protein